jgi:hypothetical protein
MPIDPGRCATTSAAAGPIRVSARPPRIQIGSPAALTYTRQASAQVCHGRCGLLGTRRPYMRVTLGGGAIDAGYSCQRKGPEEHRRDRTRTASRFAASRVAPIHPLDRAARGVERLAIGARWGQKLLWGQG